MEFKLSNRSLPNEGQWRLITLRRTFDNDCGWDRNMIIVKWSCPWERKQCLYCGVIVTTNEVVFWLLVSRRISLSYLPPSPLVWLAYIAPIVNYNPWCVEDCINFQPCTCSVIKVSLLSTRSGRIEWPLELTWPAPSTGSILYKDCSLSEHLVATR